MLFHFLFLAISGICTAICDLPQVHIVLSVSRRFHHVCHQSEKAPLSQTIYSSKYFFIVQSLLNCICDLPQVHIILSISWRFHRLCHQSEKVPLSQTIYSSKYDFIVQSLLALNSLDSDQARQSLWFDLDLNCSTL